MSDTPPGTTKVAAARDYFAQVVLEFDHHHRPARRIRL